MSPVIRNRADGMQIVMGYKDANNNEQKYIYGSKDPTPDNKFVQQVVGTLDKLVELGADQNGIINTLKDDDSYSEISEIGWDEHNSNVAGAIVWSPQGGIVTDEGDRRSPSLGLLHELGHAYYAKYDPVGEHANAPKVKDYKSHAEYEAARDKYEIDTDEKSGKYGNMDDKWVIERVEAPGAKVLGQAQRTSHHYKTKYKAENPFSIIGPEKK